jgi:uncharacterized protein YegL
MSIYDPFATDSMDATVDTSWEDAAPEVINTEKRVPLVLLLDTSDSMSGAPIGQLNEGLTVLRDALLEDSDARHRVEVALVAFGGSPQVRDLKTGHGVVYDTSQAFVSAESFTPPKLSVNGATPMASALLKALEIVDERKQYYKSEDLAYFRPWVMLITDGAPTDGNDAWKQAVQQVQAAQRDKKVALFPIGVETADMNKLNELGSAKKLQGIRFKELFVWLSASVGVLLDSGDDDKQVQLPSTDPWAQFDL